ncbi:hypothetical protein LINGRAHAP2_LOCUS9823 [Linum grandiflorum]
MDLPPPATSAATAATIHLMHYPPPESVDSSPRRTQPQPDNFIANAVNDSTPAATAAGAVLPTVPGAKLRLMCSYGGHIIPRPHDKSLCYVGGETRIVVVDRNSSIGSLSSRLSRILSLNGRPFTLKYQLPNEDLDSLVSVATDEDIEHMIDEYDRITAASAAGAALTSSCSSSPRIRLFIFFNKPVTAATMGSLKSESWFLDALNSGSPSGSDSGLPRNLSDTATMDGCLVPGFVNSNHNHQQDSPIAAENLAPAPTAAANGPPSCGSSSSSSPSAMAELLPPIRVRQVADSDHQGFEGEIQEQQYGYYQHQLSCAQIQMDSISISTTAPPAATSIVPAGGSSEHLNRVSSEDDEDTRSDQSRGGAPAAVAVGIRKPPLPLPLAHQIPYKVGAWNNLYNAPPSPDSVASDSSIASMASVQKSAGCYQEQQQSAQSDELSHQQNEQHNMVNQMGQTFSSQVPIQQQFQEGMAYTFMDQQQQQQQQQVHFVKSGPGGQLMQSYYHQPVYTHPPPQQQQYYVVAAAGSPAPHLQPPLYPTKLAAAAAPPPAAGTKPGEMGVMYTNAYASMVPGNHHQLQHQYLGYPQVAQMQQQSRHESMAVPAATSGNTNYAYEYASSISPNDQQQQQMFYAQQGMGTSNVNLMASHQQQYQTGISQQAVAADGSNQNPPVQQQIDGSSQLLQ